MAVPVLFRFQEEVKENGNTHVCVYTHTLLASLSVLILRHRKLFDLIYSLKRKGPDFFYINYDVYFLNFPRM